MGVGKKIFVLFKSKADQQLGITLITNKIIRPFVHRNYKIATRIENE